MNVQVIYNVSGSLADVTKSLTDYSNAVNVEQRDYDALGPDNSNRYASGGFKAATGRLPVVSSKSRAYPGLQTGGTPRGPPRDLSTICQSCP